MAAAQQQRQQQQEAAQQQQPPSLPPNSNQNPTRTWGVVCSEAVALSRYAAVWAASDTAALTAATSTVRHFSTSDAANSVVAGSEQRRSRGHQRQTQLKSTAAAWQPKHGSLQNRAAHTQPPQAAARPL